MSSVTFNPDFSVHPRLASDEVELEELSKIAKFLGSRDALPKDKSASLVGRIAPATRSPENVFWGLEDNWWKQIYDGKYHKHGFMVFDYGLHVKGKKEPGYYSSACKACIFAGCPENITKAPNKSFYKALHKIACQHFDGIHTLVDSDEVGKFARAWGRGCQIKVLHPNKDTPRKIAKLNAYVAHRSRELGLSHPMATFGNIYPPNKKSYNDFIFVSYQCSKEEVKKTAKTIFAEYNEKIAKATNTQEKIHIIADLFQVLEWLHPFPDGQGRTDLILLAKELSRNGLNPAILDDPFFSTTSNLEDWVRYLKDGMRKWRQAEKPHIKTVS